MTSWRIHIHNIVYTQTYIDRNICCKASYIEAATYYWDILLFSAKKKEVYVTWSPKIRIFDMLSDFHEALDMVPFEQKQAYLEAMEKEGSDLRGYDGSRDSYHGIYR